MPGRGVLLYFYTEDAQAVFDRARSMGANLLDEPHFNPNARAIEFTLRDPDGYPISVSQRRPFTDQPPGTSDGT